MTPQLNTPITSSSRQHPPQDYHYLTPTIRSPSNVTINVPETRISRDPSLRYLPVGQNIQKNDDSFEKMKYLPSPSQNMLQNRSFAESFVAVAQELSFDVKNDHHF